MPRGSDEIVVWLPWAVAQTVGCQGAVVESGCQVGSGTDPVESGSLAALGSGTDSSGVAANLLKVAVSPVRAQHSRLRKML